MNREYLALSAVNEKPHRGLWWTSLYPKAHSRLHLPHELKKRRVKGSWSAEFQEQEKGDCLGKPHAVQGSAPPEDFLKAIVA